MSMLKRILVMVIMLTIMFTTISSPTTAINVTETETIQYQLLSNKEENINTRKETNNIGLGIASSSMKEKASSLVRIPPHYDSGNITERSDITLASLKKILSGTKFEYMSEDFLRWEKEYNINVFYIIAIPALESGWGKSKRSNNGSNNITGYNVINDDSVGTYFDSWESCMERTLNLIRNQYLNKDGDYYRGFSIYDIGENYSADGSWARQLNKIISDMTNKLET